MDSGKEPVSGTRIGTEAARAAKEASGSSLDSSEPCNGVRGSKRRGKTAGTSPPDSDKCGSGTGTCVRVLRARCAAANRTSDAKNAAGVKTPVSLRDRATPATPAAPAAPRTCNAPVMQTAVKKSTDKKASKPTLGSKPSKSIRRKQRSPTPAKACKPETEMEVPSCGQEPDGEKGKNDKEKSRQRTTTLQIKDVKKEESEKTEEENGIKEEESSEIIVQNKDEKGDDTEPPSRKRGRLQKDDKRPRQPKRRKKPPVQYVRCEIEGCGTVLAHPRYLQHHIKYQHLLKKKYVCDHPSCGRLFRLQKQLLRHAKHHTDQRDYICEYCARAFKSSHNLAVHRMIHTGEKPIQCEICGFTCRQKASLNWHMKKHDAEASYLFSCSICGKRFEKKDSVVAHKAKSHPEVLIAEALAANGGSVISSPAPVPEMVPVLTQPDRPSLSQDSREPAGDTLTPLQQVVLPLTPQTPADVSQGQFFQLPMHHVVQVAHQQQVPTLLQLTAASPPHITSISQPQLIQLSTFPASTVTSMATVDSQSTLLTLNSVTNLSSAGTLAPQLGVQWGSGSNESAHIPGEGELWDRVIVGGGQQDVGEITWEENREVRKENDGIVWEREGERQIVLQCAEVHGDSLM
ncbi:E3 ubiquitin-protein ligase ZFP91-like isoform X2 [Anabas testudineus]|uniref:E3 ubiquitin-protein ligase ZFP91-like isoform X2 n=1 Tax=Anabas testudineus TaxID=64144 RepID=UPI000E45F3FC|nr:E3 ubiquitin-protein ligase ZFP91-like isoform X2 [Anabas testudineus]